MAAESHRPGTDDDLLANAIPIGTDESDASAADEDEELRPIELDATDGGGEGRKIQTFDNRVTHEDHWKRKPNVTGKGAIHVKTFVTKLRLDAVDHLDDQVNQWLDDHPEYEVKFVTTSVGKLVGKVTEEALFVNVWV